MSNTESMQLTQLDLISEMCLDIIADNPKLVRSYLQGFTGLSVFTALVVKEAGGDCDRVKVGVKLKELLENER